jgi:hypothetical protein
VKLLRLQDPGHSFKDLGSLENHGNRVLLYGSAITIQTSRPLQLNTLCGPPRDPCELQCCEKHLLLEVCLPGEPEVSIEYLWDLPN